MVRAGVACRGSSLTELGRDISRSLLGREPRGADEEKEVADWLSAVALDHDDRLAQA